MNSTSMSVPFGKVGAVPPSRGILVTDPAQIASLPIALPGTSVVISNPVHIAALPPGFGVPIDIPGHTPSGPALPAVVGATGGRNPGNLGPIPGASHGDMLPGYEPLFIVIMAGLLANPNVHFEEGQDTNAFIPIASKLTISILTHFGTYGQQKV